ncbi:hypothetical protein A5N15_00995 [Rothia kristinae]|uniref:Uncharacterized protein n=1 Tax=Rothia kristinae TaxID=37923 RepID=A0A657IW72_9MICC|nr:hypothetical protein A5N15_00995 [Rothia kristinae]
MKRMPQPIRSVAEPSIAVRAQHPQQQRPQAHRPGSTRRCPRSRSSASMSRHRTVGANWDSPSAHRTG